VLFNHLTIYPYIPQDGNITHLDSDINFLMYHTLGNPIAGNTTSKAISSNNSTLCTLYQKNGIFFNNGNSMSNGYYIVKEQY